MVGLQLQSPRKAQEARKSQTCRLACRDPSFAKEIILSTCFLIAFARV